MDGAGSQEPKAILVSVVSLHPPPKGATNFILSEGAVCWPWAGGWFLG